MDEELWTVKPLQLFDFLLIGERNVTLTKVTNAIARVGILTAASMAMVGHSQWWIVGLAILFMSVLFYYMSIYTQCHRVQGPCMAGRIESFKHVDQSLNNYMPVTIDNTQAVEILEPRYIEPVSLRSNLTPNTFVSPTSGHELHDAVTREHLRHLNDDYENHTDGQDNMRDQLEFRLVPTDYAVGFFDTYTIYNNTEPVYASLNSM